MGMRRVSLAAAVAMLWVALGAEQPAAAQSGALSGRAVQALAWFGGTAYAGTDAGLFRLTAAGWSAVSAVPSTRRVNALAVDGAQFIAGTDVGAIRSGDGNVWQSAGLSGQSVDALASQGGVLLAGTGHEGSSDGLALRSDDGGTTWAPATTVPAAEGMPGAMAQAVLAPVGGDGAWAGTAGSGALRSADGRGAWSDASAGLGSRWVTALWRDPASPSTLLAGTDDGLYQRGGGAASWSAAAFPQQDPWIQALATAGNGAALAGTYDGGVYQRSGGGWTALATGLPSVLSLLAVPADQGGGVLAGSFDGVACIACRSTLGAAASAPARPGATPLPPVANRPGASSAARAAGATSATPAAAAAKASAAAAPGTAGGASPRGGGGLPPAGWVIVAILLAASAGLTARGVRRRGT
ncbi:MAG TPA: hypothetical protein VN193_09140 [Candidatus Angelobacter sp.]|jgi:hypothetical protein|nr:hypothetical protein [Candidatus Angelobacter sp.]